MSMDDVLEEQKHYEEIYHGKVLEGSTPLGQCCGLINEIKSVPDIIEEIIIEGRKISKKGSKLYS